MVERVYTREELERAAADSDELRRIHRLRQDGMSDFVDSLKGRGVEWAGSEYRVRICSPEEFSAEENRRRWAAYLEATSVGRAMEVDRSHRKSAETEAGGGFIPIVYPDGTTRYVAGHLEMALVRKLEAKGVNVRPIIRWGRRSIRVSEDGTVERYGK